MMMRSVLNALLMVGSILTASGCGKELTAGGRQQVEVVATDRDPADQGAATRRGEPEPARPSQSYAQQVLPAPIEGRVQFQAAASLRREGGEIVRISPEIRSGALRIAAGDLLSLGSTAPRTGRYTHVIVEFTAVTAEIETATGTTLQVAVGIGPQPLLVERPIDLLVDDAEPPATVEVDLRTSIWAPLAVGGTVPAQVFAASVTARTR